MGTDNDTKGSNPSKIEPLKEYNSDQETFEELDERDMLEPLNEARPEENEQQDGNETDTPVDMDAVEAEIDLNDSDQSDGSISDGDEIEIDLNNSGGEESEAVEEDTGENETEFDETEATPDDIEGKSEEIEEVPDESEKDPEDEEQESEEPNASDDTLDTQSEDAAGSVSETAGDSDESSDDDTVDETHDDESVDDGDSTETMDPSAAEPEKTVDEKPGDNDFGSLDNDEVGDDTGANETGAKAKEEQSPANVETVQEGESPKKDDSKVTEKKDSAKIEQSDGKKLTPLKDTSGNQQTKTPAKKAATVRKIIAAAAIILIVAGYAVYHRSSGVGSGIEKEPERPVAGEIPDSAEPVKIPVQSPKPSGKPQLYQSKLNEVDHLRDKLLAKKEEIYRLKLHYRDGISDLQDQIANEMQQAGISTLDQALKNRRIELSLRTIQRRQNYIQELEKPDLWVHRGSEELLFLKRKAELDLQMVDIASGIDMDRHMRYLNSAIQKYQPSAEKLAVDPLPLETTPMEAIWDQIIQKQAGIARTPIGSKDQDIISEICSGNFKRIAELTTITPDAARCLSRVNSSELFLNGLTRVSTEDAKYLFQWQGNWICLNGIKELSPAVARHLFRWNGNWISLNGLTEFPPELAVYLMEWKGNQLELMGLKYNQSKPDLKALKYLALWETMGGKLYVSERVRKEMNRVM